MSGRPLLPLLVLAALAACATTPVAVAPAPVPARREATPVEAATPRAPMTPALPLREAVEGLLERAGAAAAMTDESGFARLESEILRELVLESDRDGCSDEFSVYVADVLDDLDGLRELLAAGEQASGEPPPEPQPVPEELVAAVAAEASDEKFDLPVVINAEVTSLIEFYTGRYREKYAAALQRAGRFLPYIRERLRAANLPQDLAFLPLVESAFNPQARSRARAQGLWQFMVGTGRLYDLRADGLVDERNDPYLATDAAVAHLGDLYATFGDWALALAAYNSGTGRVARALKRAGGTRDFWELRRFLPRETRNYVPALWAVLVTVKNAEAYGLPAIPESPDCLARVDVAGALDLAVLAERAAIAEDDLADLNPALIHRITPATGSYRLAVPCGREAEVQQAIVTIPPEERVRRFVHVVCRGDTLGVIARRYGSSVEAVKQANGIRDPRRLRIGQKLIVPRAFPGKGKGVVTASTGASTIPSRSSYVVRRGDTLAGIARRFGLSIQAIQQANNLAGSLIHPGDVLKFH